MNAMLAALACILAPGAAPAQGVMAFSWDLNDSGSDTATILPGETANLKLWATWEPYEFNFAGSLYGIVGLRGWDRGVVLRYDNYLDALTDDGDLQPNNDILNVESFSLPPLYGFYHHPPLLLYEIEWIPLDYTRRTVRVTDGNHLGNWVYTDSFGSSAEYETGHSNGATIHIVPAPFTLSLLLIGPTLRRRR